MTTAISSTQQYGRTSNLVIGTGGKGISIASSLGVPGLRVTFQLVKTIGRHPNPALFKIYNLTQAHENQIKGEFSDILLNAGYGANPLLIFSGTIKHVRGYRDGNDYITEIEAAEGDSDFRNSTVNFTLAAGTTTQQLINQIASNFTGGTKMGTVVIKDRTRLRGRTVSGMARDVLDDVAAESDANWSIQDGKLMMVRVDSTLPTEAIVVRSDTGMLGAPEIDNVGIKVKTLLDPRIKINGKIWLDNNDLKQKVSLAKGSKPGAKAPKNKIIARLDPDGIYKVYKQAINGDTRGGDWVTQSFCVALSQPIPSGRASPAVVSEDIGP